ncbi:MAG: cytochrome P450 [Candidatus Eremiobacteraeota bacterium]|nr:cytochrome P450 [Candidatus Eremiobacteraeota bacterium]MCW5866245.1 cytochrome P450 [Candidatus Eremiobacteraeota bacterium]
MEPFCLVDPEKLRHPFPDYEYCRRENPVFFYEPMNAWFVFRYADVDRLFHDERLSNARMGGYVPGALPSYREAVEWLFANYFRHWLLSLDGEPHRALRRHLQPHFSERAVSGWVPAIEEMTGELLDRVAAQGFMDFSRDFAYELPVLVISSLLGVPAGERRRVIGWSDHLANYFNVIPPTEQTSAEMVDSTREMIDYLEGLLRQRRSRPEADLLSRMAGSGLEEAVIVANAMVLLVAGHETTRNLMGSCVSLLLRHPDQLARLRADMSLLPRAIDETLRMEPANPIMARLVAEDFEYAGDALRRGQLLFLGIGSANRDPAFVEDPERFDIGRKPGKHLGFGSGPHFCIGSILARREASIALRELLTRFPGLRGDGPEEWVCQAGMRGPLRLPIRWT